MLYRTYRKLRYEMRCIASLHPLLYDRLARLKEGDADGPTRVTRHTDLVIEAFPRSGNTFAYFAFQSSQPSFVRVAHHLHAPAQLMQAARWRIPALLIVRDPLDAVCSFVQREPVLSLRQALRSWIQFHRSLVGRRQHFVVVTFDQAMSDFGSVVERLNRRFSTTFGVFEHDVVNTAACFRAIEERNKRLSGRAAPDESGVARPSAVREAAKAGLRDALAVAALAPLREEALRLYQDYAMQTGEDGRTAAASGMGAPR